MRYLSPLRYPGGKDRLATFVASLIEQQSDRPTTYVEPFAGGAGVALRLLHDEVVDEVVLNDLDPAIAAFWRAVFFHTKALTKLIRACRPTIEEWHRQHERYARLTGSDVDLGFATFFLNRTNRSGILHARPIGGFDQTGPWGIDARFNSEQLADRVVLLGRYASRVTVLEEDGASVIQRFAKKKDAFIYADPPYLRDGDRLYLNRLAWDDHVRLARHLTKGDKWLLTYDEDPRISDDLYKDYRCMTFDIAHTAARRHIGREHAVFADGLEIDGAVGHLGSNARLL
jgi:DNA adenine methylase